MSTILKTFIKYILSFIVLVGLQKFAFHLDPVFKAQFTDLTRAHFVPLLVWLAGLFFMTNIQNVRIE